MARRMRTGLLVAAFAAGLTSVAFAQAGVGPDAGREGRPADVRDTVGFNPGWLGLIGLAGLAGLMGKSSDSYRSEARGGSTASMAR